MEGKLLSLKLDVIFKVYFTRNQELLKHFVASILDIPIQEIRSLICLNTEIPPESPEGKDVRLDLNLALNAQSVNIEIQVKKYPDFQARALFYWAKLFTRMLKSGEKYCMLKPAITVSIVDYILFEEREKWYADVVAMFPDTHKIFTDKLQLRFIELPKYARTHADGLLPEFHSRMEQWMYLFNARTEQEMKNLEEYGDDVMKEACEKLRELSQDDALWEAEWTREKELHDFASAVGAAKEEGREEGREEGEKIGLDKATSRIHANLLRLGYSEEQIQTILE